MLLQPPAFPPDEIDRSHEVLEFTGLAAHADQLGKESATRPSAHPGYCHGPGGSAAALMLDEPVTGMNLDESRRVMALVKTIRDRGTTILLVEHNMRAVMGTCERIVVLNFGEKLAEGLRPRSAATRGDRGLSGAG